MRDYTKIGAWKLADDLTVMVYERTRSFPKEEVYGLTSQLRRASYSVAANIVEGSSRESKRDYLHFLYIARGSLEETLSHIVYAQKVGYISEALFKSLALEGENVNRLINGYIGFLKKSKQGANEPGANYSIREDTADYNIEDDSISSESNIE